MRDQERRAHSEKAKPFVDAGADAALAAALEDFSVIQSGQPGGLVLDGEPSFQALASADPGLLWALVDHDDRLTCSVEFHRDFMPGRHILSVRGLAYRALSRGMAPGAAPDRPKGAVPRAEAGIGEPLRSRR